MIVSGSLWRVWNMVEGGMVECRGVEVVGMVWDIWVCV